MGASGGGCLSLWRGERLSLVLPPCYGDLQRYRLGPTEVYTWRPRITITLITQTIWWKFRCCRTYCEWPLHDVLSATGFAASCPPVFVNLRIRFVIWSSPNYATEFGCLVEHDFRYKMLLYFPFCCAYFLPHRPCPVESGKGVSEWKSLLQRSGRLSEKRAFVNIKVIFVEAKNIIIFLLRAEEFGFELIKAQGPRSASVAETVLKSKTTVYSIPLPLGAISKP